MHAIFSIFILLKNDFLKYTISKFMEQKLKLALNYNEKFSPLQENENEKMDLLMV
jgi:hypothetical protein